MFAPARNTDRADSHMTRYSSIKPACAAALIMAYSPETENKMTVRFWHPVMRQGVIEFDRPEQCPITRPVRDMECKTFGETFGNFQSVDSLAKEAE